jgi:hypothetical protein
VPSTWQHEFFGIKTATPPSLISLHQLYFKLLSSFSALLISRYFRRQVSREVQLTNPLKHSPSWATARRSDITEFPNFNGKWRYTRFRIFIVWSPRNPLYSLNPYFFKINLIFILHLAEVSQKIHCLNCFLNVCTYFARPPHIKQSEQLQSHV